MRQHVVMFSGGAGSWAAGKRVAERHGIEGLTLLFADTLMEDEDLYRFVREAAADVGGEFIQIAEGRDPWQVFHDVRFLGNTRADPCSRILKRDFMRKWLVDNRDPAETTVYLGIDWSEVHRMDRAEKNWAPWSVEAPMCDAPYLDKSVILDELRAAGIEPPRLYGWGMPHNNCGGFCIKAGQSQFALLLEADPERYAYHEQREQELREYLGKDVAILRDRTGGQTRPLTLAEFRTRSESGQSLPMLEQVGGDWGGCGCAVDG